MSDPTRRWILKSVADPQAVDRVSNDLNGLAEPLARSLVLRGIQTFDDARRYFRAGIGELHDPFLMRDMPEGAARLAAAVRSGERVLVYGDYDVDGITATAAVTHFLRERGVPAAYFIPDRLRHGYGLCTRGLDHALEARASLVVALDCGITATQEAIYARNLGMDLIVCDHHTPPATLPEAVARLDPKRPDCPYPYKELCGCGVAFKLLQATATELGEDPAAIHVYLDLVALATASDVVPLTGENRVLLREGLTLLRESSRLGLRALAEVARVHLPEATTRSILFGLGPRLNAAGRLGDARRAVRLLLSESEPDATGRARMLDRLNQDRRSIEQATVDEAVQEADRQPSGAALVLFRPDWHIGVLGIVASRLVERYRRPAVLLGLVGEVAKGSGRSIPGVNIHDALSTCAHLLEAFGGHDYAAGLTIRPERLDAFREAFRHVTDPLLTSEALDPPLALDARVRLGEIDERFWAVLRQFEPFGPANEQPLFHTPGLQVVGEPAIVGRDGRHLKFRVREDDGAALDVIAFGLSDRAETVRDSARRGIPLEVAHTVGENTWNGLRSMQLTAEAVRLEAPPSA